MFTVLYNYPLVMVGIELHSSVVDLLNYLA